MSSKRLAQDDVVLLVEARLQLDQHRHLLAALGRLRQQARDLAAGAVERDLDREHVGIVGGRARSNRSTELWNES